MIKIYHNNRCSKSRCALELLETSKKPFEIVYYLENTPTVKELKQLLKLLNIKPIELIRTNESIWKEQFKSSEFSDNELIKIMVKHPKLIERPIIVNGNKAVIGRPTEKILEIL